MKPGERDISSLKHIVHYCDEITDTIEQYNLTLEKITSEYVYKNSLAMSVLQIGELVSILSEDFLTTHKDMPWSEIKRMRDKAAHHYGSFDVATLWETVTEDIEPLKSFCEACLLQK